MRVLLLSIMAAVVSRSATSAATAGVACWTNSCEFDFQLTLGESLTLTQPGGSVKELRAQAGGCLKLEDAADKDPCLEAPMGVTGSRFISADGRMRDVLLVNGQFPGPTIEVTEGATVIVHVENHMSKVNTAIHWHGQRMQQSQWMDGVAYVTQCPIQPGHTFTYRFVASPSGTHWYHPHIGNLRSDGHYGLLVVHRARPALPEFPLLLSDLTMNGGLGARLTDFRIGSIAELPDPVSGLINGRGRHVTAPNAPLSWFRVEAGKRYRFRCVNAAMDTGFAVSVDDHVLNVVALDGTDIKPVQVDFATIFPGEQMDFEIQIAQGTGTSGPPSAWWLRGKALGESSSSRNGSSFLDSFAVITTATQLGSVDPTSQPRPCTAGDKCAVLNCNKPFTLDQHKVCIDLSALHVANASRVLEHVSRSPADEYFLNFQTSIGDSINARRFVHPQSPFYDRYPLDLVSCRKAACRDNAAICWCSNGLALPRNKLVTLVVSNIESQIDEGHIGHPVHIHGHTFAIVAQGFGRFNPDTGIMLGNNGAIACDSPMCRNPGWSRPLSGPPGGLHLDVPPLRDTTIVPPGGYVVLRLFTDNPGYWLLHCHLLRDQLDGMLMYLSVTPEEVHPPPSQLHPCSPHLKGTARETESDDADDLDGEEVSLIQVLGLSLSAICIVIFLVLLCVMLTRWHPARNPSVATMPFTHGEQVHT